FVAKLTCSFGLKLFISSRIHCRAAPMPRVGESVDDNELRVSKLSSFLRVAPRRSCEMGAISATMRGSMSPADCAKRLRLVPDATRKAARTIDPYRMPRSLRPRGGGRVSRLGSPRPQGGE